MLKLVIGGSPCTRWSIAQTKDRETEPSGIGWELFLNYRIARDKYQPDYVLYENNKSMAPAIKAQITKELGVDPVLIDSALVSAQSRQRLYWYGKRNPDGTYSQLDVEQPEDRGILLRDVLESGVVWNEKSYCLTTRCQGAIPENTIPRHQHQMVAEPVNVTADEKARTLKAQYYKNGIANFVTNDGFSASAVAEPVRIGTIENDAKNADFDSQQYRVYSPDGKSVTMCGNGGGEGAKTGLYDVPVNIKHLSDGEIDYLFRRPDRVGYGYIQNADNAKAKCITANISKGVPYNVMFECTPCIVWTENGLTATAEINNKVHTFPIYEVRAGLITIKGKQYPIKLADGHYIIRKLTVTECKRLQTVPEWYQFPVSNTQAYKMLGNGWTVDAIAHILSHIPGITTEALEVLSMYDGMSCGHIALDKLGANVVRYYATEIDKYAVKTTMENYSATVQLGDAFQVREDGWTPHNIVR